MFKSITILASVILASIVVYSCTDTPSTPPEPNVVSENRIEGSVLLFDSHANAVSDLAGVVVSVVSTSNVEYLDTTSANGSYSISDVPAGSYTITASHPDYDGPATHYAFYRSRDFQYVGAGVFSVSDLSLSAPMSSTMISNLTPLVSWKYVTSFDSHTGKTDTTDVLAELTVNFDFAHVGSLTEPIITLAEAADASCADAVLKPVWITIRDTTAGVCSYRISNFFAEMRNRFGQDVYTKQFYVQVRPKCVVKESGSQSMIAHCLDPVSFPVQFTRP